MKKIFIPFFMIALAFAQVGCDLLPDNPENPEKKWIKVVCQDASIEKKDADYIIKGSNDEWMASITLLDGVQEGAGKYTQYKGSITSLETNEKEILAIEEAAAFKLLDANHFQLVANMRGEKVYYEITLEGTIEEDIKVKPELESEEIICTNATIDTIGQDLVFNASNTDWTVSITLPDAATNGVGKYPEYDGCITNTLNEKEILKVEDMAVFSFVNDTTFKLVAEMEGATKVYAISITGIQHKKGSSNQDTDSIGILFSPDEQKTLLVEVGEQLLASFNPADQKKAVELADDLYYKYKNYDWDAIGEEFDEEWSDIYSAELESFFGMPKRVIDAINGKRKASLQDLEILLTLSKFGRLIEFDDKSKTVKITQTNESTITAKFSDSNDVACQLKVWGEGKEIEGSYTYEDYHWENGYGKRTIRVKIPTTIKMYLKHGSSTLVSYTFKWDSNLNDYINTSLEMQVINLGFQEQTKVSTTEASAVFSFTCNNKNIITAAVSLPKYKLFPWEGGSDVTEEDGINWLEEYEDKYKSLLGKVGTGEVKVDILGKVQLKGGMTDGAALVDAYYNWDNKYNNYNWEDYKRTYTYTYVYEYWDWWYDEYGNYHDGYKTEYIDEESDYSAWWETPRYTLAAKQEQCNFLNKYAYLSVYYNNTTTEQAKLLMDTYEENSTYDPVEWMRYDSDYTNLPNPIPYTYYEIEPVMYFPYDDTQIAVMTYFNSSKFLGIIDLVEELANSYIALDKHNLVFGEDFEVEIDY